MRAEAGIRATQPRWRALAHFLLIGLVLFGARHALGGTSEPDRIELQVTVSASASPAAIALAVQEEILVDLALRSGWARGDPLVADRLARNMRFGDDRSAAESSSVLLDRANSLGMQRSDPVARRRLSTLARRALGASPSEVPPTDALLAAYARAHADRYFRPAAVRFSQLLLSAERRGTSLEADAAALALRFADSPPAPSDAGAWSDPTLLAHQVGSLDERRIDARFGPGFGRQLLDAATGRWVGPLRSTYGLHFVWIHEHLGESLPPVDEIRAALTRDLLAERRDERVRAALRWLRSGYRIQLVRTP